MFFAEMGPTVVICAGGPMKERVRYFLSFTGKGATSKIRVSWFLGLAIFVREMSLFSTVVTLPFLSLIVFYWFLIDVVQVHSLGSLSIVSPWPR